jgi:hypothetical protein
VNGETYYPVDKSRSRCHAASHGCWANCHAIPSISQDMRNLLVPESPKMHPLTTNVQRTQWALLWFQWSFPSPQKYLFTFNISKFTDVLGQYSDIFFVFTIVSPIMCNMICFSLSMICDLTTHVCFVSSSLPLKPSPDEYWPSQLYIGEQLQLIAFHLQNMHLPKGCCINRFKLFHLKNVHLALVLYQWVK